MKIDEDILARIYSFDLQFKGGKRTLFYRKLLGFKSKTTREDKNGRERVYENFYPGVLTPLPHLRLGKSVVAVPKAIEDKIDDFFEDSRWGPIDLYSFDGILPHEDRMASMEEVLDRIKVTRDTSLRSELDFLLSLEDREQLGSEEGQRVKRVLKRFRELMNLDWTDGGKFSEKWGDAIKPLKRWID